MSFVTSEKILQDAKRHHYAVGAFNVENMEMIKAVIKAAEVERAPVILQTTPSSVRYATLKTFVSMARAEADQAAVPVVLHLDHGDSFSLAVRAIKEGYTSVMIDGSLLPFEENITLTKRVVEAAAPNNIPVEAELGHVGGREDEEESRAGLYTETDEAAQFVSRTGVSSLAVAVGTAHGFYNKKPVLNQQRLKEIKEAVSVPLVLHGASGLSDNDIGRCILYGICKVNFATELRTAYTEAVRLILREQPGIYDPKAMGKAAMEQVTAQVRHRIRICSGMNTAR